MILQGRALPPVDLHGRCFPTGRCVFCNSRVKHVVDKGVGKVAGGVLYGVPQHYLYCHSGCGAAEDRRGIWTCGVCAVDNLTDQCHACSRRRPAVDAAHGGAYARVMSAAEVAIPGWVRLVSARVLPCGLGLYVLRFRSGEAAARWAGPHGPNATRYYSREEALAGIALATRPATDLASTPAVAPSYACTCLKAALSEVIIAQAR